MRRVDPEMVQDFVELFGPQVNLYDRSKVLDSARMSKTLISNLRLILRKRKEAAWVNRRPLNSKLKDGVTGPYPVVMPIDPPVFPAGLNL